LKLYRRLGERLLLPPTRLHTSQAIASEPSPEPQAPAPHLGVSHARSLESPLPSLEEEVVQAMPLGVVVIDRHYDIHLLNRAARSLLSIHGVALGEDLIHLTRAISPVPFRALIDQAFQARQAPVTAELAAEDHLTGLSRSLYLSVTPYQRGGGEARPELV